MASIPTRLALFDCDGTLIDSQAMICTAMETAFEGQGIAPPSRHDIRRIVGLSLPIAMRRLHADGEADVHDALVEGYRKAFIRLREDQVVREPLFPGIGDTLKQLHGDGWALGVATGKSDRGLDHALEVNGIAELFSTLQTADRHPSKPDPAMAEEAMTMVGALPEASVMIGDTVFDIEMAAAAGMAAIGVDWGYHDPHELEAAGALSVVSSSAELYDALTDWSKGKP